MPASLTTSLPAAAAKRFLRILYAEDVPELREVARICLSREGHGIECVADGDLALRRIAADPGFDAVVTDHHMPNMNGLELVHQLRVRKFAGRVLVFTSEVDPAISASYRRLNVDRILYKPVYPAVLAAALADLFPGVARPQVSGGAIDVAADARR